ncbi:MAG: hypothetical protein IJ911_06370 [Salinivirgaceae bacterium]|nr:hypothetical protein [Salinivirgaceae bacterium]
MSKPNSKLSIVFMWLLTVANLITFYYQPIPFSIFAKPGDKWAGLFWLFMIPVVFVYAVLAVAGVVSLMRGILYLFWIDGETKKITKVTMVAVSVSLLAVGYGTFLKKQSFPELVRAIELAKWKDEHVLLKYGGGYEIERDECIWRGDTVIYNAGIGHAGKKGEIDTLVVDNASNTCHWTYKPMVNYHIEYFYKNKFTQDAANVTYCPDEYFAKIQYIINYVNNKKVDEFYYDKNIMWSMVQTDSNIFFLSDKGYILFGIENGVAVLRDSMSNIYDLRDYPEPDDGFNYSMRLIKSYQKENGWPLLEYLFEKSKYFEGYVRYYDLFDVETKKFVLYHAIDFERHHDTVNNYEVVIDHHFSNSSAYSTEIIDRPTMTYLTVREIKDLDLCDTLEFGTYVMRDGKYVKEVLWNKESNLPFPIRRTPLAN